MIVFCLGGSNVLEDTGYRPETDGFSFENFGDEICDEAACENASGMTVEGMQRMFGDGVCRQGTEAGTCKLTRPAEAWLESANEMVSGGHCEGMSVLSALFFAGAENPQNFGGSSAHSLDIRGNTALQSELTYWAATQLDVDYEVVVATPSDQLQTLIDYYAGNPKYLMPIGIYKRDGSDGHAILSYGVEKISDEESHILVYDNNYPDEDRYIVINTEENSWHYSGADNPDSTEGLYDGNDLENPLQLVPIDSRVNRMFTCPFCTASSTASGKVSGVSVMDNSNMFSADADINVLIQDEYGNESGYDWEDDKTHDEIEGVSIRRSENGTTVMLPKDLSYDLWMNRPDEEEYAYFNASITAPGSVFQIDNVLESVDYSNMFYEPPTYDDVLEGTYETFGVIAKPDYLPKVTASLADGEDEYHFAFSTNYAGDEAIDGHVQFSLYNDKENGILAFSVSPAGEEDEKALAGVVFYVWGDFYYDTADGEKSMYIDEDDPLEIQVYQDIILDYRNIDWDSPENTVFTVLSSSNADHKLAYKIPENADSM